MRPSVTAESFLAAVRVHADRVHDAVRRQGRGPEAAVRVVQASALDLLDTVAHRPVPPDQLVGQWFARARALGSRAEASDLKHGDGELPVGRGLLAADDAQALLTEALESRPERERAALLLRDAYDLPAATVGAALGTDPDRVMELVGRARMALLPAPDAVGAAALAGHPVDLGALARVAEGGMPAARDAATRKHAQSCQLCRPAVQAQDDARRRLAALSVVALPDADRERLLEHVASHARAVLPAEVVRRAEVEEQDDEPRRLLSPLPVLLALTGAVGLGVALGVLLSGDEPQRLAQVSLLPPVTAPALPTVQPPAPVPAAPLPGQAPGQAEPTTTVFTLPPVTTPPPEPPAPPPAVPSPPAAPAAALLVDPVSGPNGQEVTVSGAGFQPGAIARLSYLDPAGGSTGLEVDVVVDGTGGFTEQLVLRDPLDTPGPHTVRAADGSATAETSFQAG